MNRKQSILSSVFNSLFGTGKITVPAQPLVRKYEGFFVTRDGEKIRGELAKGRFVPGEKIVLKLSLSDPCEVLGDTPVVAVEFVDQDGFWQRCNMKNPVFVKSDCDMLYIAIGDH